MALLQFYSIFILNHPTKVIILGISSVIFLLLLTISIRPLPSFKDPIVGFEGRDTLIASRLNAWRLLMEDASYSYKFDGIKAPNVINHDKLEPPVIEMSTAHVSDTIDEDEEEYYRSVNSTANSYTSLMHYSLDSSKAFCGLLYEGYAQFVVSPSGKQIGSGLLNFNSMMAICQLDHRLRLEQSLQDNSIFQRDCERFRIDENDEDLDKASITGNSFCCNSWSLPNYIACLGNKTSCNALDQDDIYNFEHLLHSCAPYYHKSPYEECFIQTSKSKNPFASTLNILTSGNHHVDMWPRSNCGKIPEKCLKCDGWTFYVLHYLVNHNFTSIKHFNDSFNKQKPPRPSQGSRRNSQYISKLTHTNIFLPIAKSSSLLKYYNALSKYSLRTPFARIKAMDLGMKNTLFEHLLTEDTRLFLVALLTILAAISIYAWSIVLSMVILLIICLSVCLSFSIYELVLNVPIFPFMNLLAIVISFGICSDNAMLFCKHWETREDNDNHEQIDEIHTIKTSKKEQANLNRVLRRAILSSSIATLATACSFAISAVSKITAVRCFCIFSTLSVITNYILVVILLPPALVLDLRWSESVTLLLSSLGPKWAQLVSLLQQVRLRLLQFGDYYRIYMMKLVTSFRYYLIITFITLFLCSSVLVFYWPTLQPSDSIQLLSNKHMFEQYDKNMRRNFVFERSKQGDLATTRSTNGILEALPVRVIFGIEPKDTGNLLDPQDRGSLVFDPKFDLADPNAQTWLLDFCQKLRQQRFIQPTQTNDPSSCFIETFKHWIENRNCRDPIQSDLDRSPCCQNYKFPFSRSTFNECIEEAVEVIRKTPVMQHNFNAGVRFFKNSTRVAALIVEFYSNRFLVDSFSKMDRFFNDINEWVSWQINNTAPPGLKSGWFISSNLELLALQTELEQSTSSSILLEIVFAAIALILSTRDIVLTLAGTLTIATIIVVTVAALILLRWTLGIAESIMISLTIGLSIDFAIHYSVAYEESKRVGSNNAIIQSILNRVGSPIALATVTTSLAGFVIIWSDILAYQQLGTFLILIATVSWSTSTFLLLPIISTVVSLKEFNRNFQPLSPIQRQLKFLMDRL